MAGPEPTALTVRETREGLEVRVRYSYDGRAPTFAKRRDAAKEMLRALLAGIGGAQDLGFSEDSKGRTGVATMFVEAGPKEGG